MAILGCRAGAVCNVPLPRLVCAEYFQSRAVVIAKLTTVRHVKDKDDFVTGTYYSMTVEQPLRGEVARLFRLYESNDSGRATFDWKTDDSYLLFLLRQTRNGAWVIDGCGNSGPLERKQKALEQIDAIEATSDRALIGGAVGSISSSYPLAGVQVEARGPGGIICRDQRRRNLSNARYTGQVPDTGG